MTTQFLTDDLKSDEGCKLEAYPDPLSGAEPWTIGYGQTGRDICKGVVWTQEQADVALADAINTAEGELDQHAPWWRSMNDARQDVMVNMCFNMGWPRLSGFHKFLAAAEAGDYETAAEEMADSAWARQLPSRSTRLATQMRKGIRA